MLVLLCAFKYFGACRMHFVDTCTYYILHLLAHLEITIAAITVVTTAATIAAIIVATPTKPGVVITATAAGQLLQAVEGQVRLASLVCTGAQVVFDLYLVSVRLVGF